MKIAFIGFTFFWNREKRWERRNFCVEVVENAASDASTPVPSIESIPLKEASINSNRPEQSLTPVH
jgi:hypothetical protein